MARQFRWGGEALAIPAGLGAHPARLETRGYKGGVGGGSGLG